MIRSKIKESANNFLTPNSQYGYGIPDFENALDLLNLENCDIFGEKSLFSVFPNPSSGIVKLRLNSDKKVNILVFDVMGKMIYSFDNQKYDMCNVDDFLSSLNGGVYFVKVVGEEFDQTSKLIKY